MNLNFNKSVSEPFIELITYSSLNPIPLILKLSKDAELPETIYTRNLAGENFIELRFNKKTKKLYEITIVAIQEDSVKLGVNDCISSDEFYECYIEDDRELDISKPIQILRSDESLLFSWGAPPSQLYTIAENCILGVDVEKKLSAIFLINLSNEVIYEILGF